MDAFALYKMSRKMYRELRWKKCVGQLWPHPPAETSVCWVPECMTMERNSKYFSHLKMRQQTF